MKSVKQMTIEIIESGIKEPELAKLVGTSQPSINRIKSGETADPRYTMGKAIEAIHRDRVDQIIA